MRQGDGVFGDMSEVDGKGCGQRYARLCEESDARLDEIHDEGHRCLGVQRGQAIIDVGTGTGDRARELAERVGAEGRVVAVDKSEELLALARSRGDGGVEFLQADASKLPFADDCFDAARAERLLQHLDEPELALREIVRVTKAGGRVMVIDADYGCLCIDASDRELTREIVRTRCENAKHGWIGRELPRRFVESGLEIERVESFSFTRRSLRQVTEIFSLDHCTQQVVRSGKASLEAAQAWWSELEQRDREGRFFLTSTSFRVVGRLP